MTVRQAAALVAALCLAACGPAALTDADRAAIHRLDSAYVAAWLADDTAGVMATLTEDAVLLPAGQRPLTTLADIRAFWWPDDGSTTTITSYTTTVDEIAGAGDLAYVRGTGALSFVWERDSMRSEVSSRNMSLTVVRKGPDGAWRIARRMWGPRND